MKIFEARIDPKHTCDTNPFEVILIDMPTSPIEYNPDHGSFQVKRGWILHSVKTRKIDHHVFHEYRFCETN